MMRGLIRGAFLAGGLILMGMSSASDNWVCANGDNDPDSQWSTENQAYDANTNTYASNLNVNTPGWGGFLEFTYAAAVHSDRLRILNDFGYGYVDSVDVDVQYDGSSAWMDAYEGTTPDCEYKTIFFTAGEVKRVRFRFHYVRGNITFWLYELQVHNTGDPLVDPTAASAAATSVNANNAVLHGVDANDGGAPCETRFQYGLTESYGTETAWSGESVTVNTVGFPLSGLTDATTYHFRMQARNRSDGTVASGADMTFTTGTPGSSDLWISPTGVSDPDSKWTSEEHAMDDESASVARSQHAFGNSVLWGGYLYLSVPSGTYNGVRLAARYDSYYIDKLDLDVCKDGVWVDVYEGSFANREFQGFSFAEGTVTQARVRFHCTMSVWGGYWELNEFDFHKGGELTVETASASVTSPAWVEGTVWYKAHTVTAMVDGVGATLTRLHDQDWYVTNAAGGSPAGVTLSAMAATAVEIRAYENGTLKATANRSLVWTPTDVTGKTSTSDGVTIRKGDSLLLTGTGAGTELTIDANGDGVTDYAGAPGGKFAYPYSTAGTFLVTAKIDGASIGTYTVTAAEITTAGAVNCVKGTQREKVFSVTPDAAKSRVEADASDYAKITIQARNDVTAGVKVLFTPMTAGTAAVVLRLGTEERSPILSTVATTAATLTFSGMTHEPVLKAYADGDFLAGQSVTLTPKLEGMAITMTMIAGGGLFEATGASDLVLNSDDFDENGQCNYYLVTPPSAVNCHFIGVVKDTE